MMLLAVNMQLGFVAITILLVIVVVGLLMYKNREDKKKFEKDLDREQEQPVHPPVKTKEKV